MRPTKVRPAILLAVSVCSAAPATAGQPASLRTAVTSSADALRTNWRYIGVLKRNPELSGCPTPKLKSGNWTTQALFAVEWPDGPAPSAEEPPLLHEFCVYETTDENPGEAPFDPLDPPYPFTRLDTDFMGVMTSGGRIEAAYANELSAHFASQAGDVVLPRPDDRPPVRLAIVDTAATRDVGAEDYRGTSEHGFSLLNVVSGLLCDTRCRLRGEDHLASGAGLEVLRPGHARPELPRPPARRPLRSAQRAGAGHPPRGGGLASRGSDRSW